MSLATSRSGSSKSDSDSGSSRPWSRHWEKVTSQSRPGRKGKHRKRASRSCSQTRSRDSFRQSRGGSRQSADKTWSWADRMLDGKESIELSKPITFPESDMEHRSDNN